MHHKNSVIVNNTDYHMGNTQGLVLTYDSCNLDDCTYWEIDWGSGDFDVSFSNCKIPSGFNMDIIDVDRYRIKFSNCDLYEPDINLAGALATDSELLVTNCNIFQTGLTTSAAFYFSNMSNENVLVAFANCVFDCQALLYNVDNTSKDFIVTFTGCYGDIGTNDLGAGGVTGAVDSLHISNCRLDAYFRNFQRGVITNSWIRGATIFYEVSTLEISNSMLAPSEKLVENTSKNINMRLSSCEMELYSFEAIIKTDDNVYLWIDSCKIYGDSSDIGNLIEKTIAATSTVMEVIISASDISYLKLKQTCGTLYAVISGNNFDDFNVEAAGTGNPITMSVTATGNSIYLPCPPGITYKYFVQTVFTGTNNHDVYEEVHLSGNTLYCLVSTAGCLGAGFVGFETDATGILDNISGRIVIDGCVLEAYTSVDLLGQDIALLVSSSTGFADPPVLMGSVALTSNTIYASQSNPLFGCAAIVRGVSGNQFPISTVTGGAREGASLVVISDCHQVGGKSSSCKIDISTVNQIVSTMSIEDVTHTYFGATQTFRVELTCDSDYSTVSISKVNNATSLSVRVGEYGAITVHGCTNSLIYSILDEEVDFMCSGCNHGNIPNPDNLITLSASGAGQIINCTGLHGRFASAVNGYLVKGGFAINGGLIATCTQFQGNSDTDFGAPVSALVNFRYT